MVFVHVHKAAGSFMCGMASLNSERIVEPGVNCNWVLHDDFKQMGDGVRVTCEERAEQFSNVSWAHIEREFTDQDFCPQHFDYVTVLREPVGLAQSEVNFRNFSVGELEASLGCTEGLEPCDESHKDDNVPLWKFLDNFQVRMLGGMETWKLPPGGVLPKHKDKVVKLLERFYRVIPFGRLKSNPTLLETSFGWSIDQLAQKDPMGDWERNPRNPAMRPCNFTFSAAQSEGVRRASRLDAELHEHFQTRFADGITTTTTTNITTTSTASSPPEASPSPTTSTTSSTATTTTTTVTTSTSTSTTSVTSTTTDDGGARAIGARGLGLFFAALLGASQL